MSSIIKASVQESFWTVCRILAVYYFNRAGDAVDCNGGVRHIAATIFEAPY